MRVEKREQYINHLYACLHTLSGYADNVNDTKANDNNMISTCSRKKKYKQEEHHYYLQINPNKNIGSNTMIKTYSEFEKVLLQLLTDIDVKDFKLSRTDLCFNSDHDEDYELFKKLNKLLICCIAEAYKVKNCYKSEDLWTSKQLSIAIINDRFEVENYDKEAQSNGTTETKNRFELRSKRVSGNTFQDEFLVKWFDRLDKAIINFENVQKHYNIELTKLWTEDLKKCKKEREYISLTAFLLRFKDCIFTRKQLIELVEGMNMDNITPVIFAKNFKSRHSIEFFSKTDLITIVDALKRATEDYFMN